MGKLINIYCLSTSLLHISQNKLIKSLHLKVYFVRYVSRDIVNRYKSKLT
jgi:hypothetical protein